MRTTVVLFLVCLLWVGQLYPRSQNFSFSNYLPRVEQGESALVVKINTLGQSREFFIYYRAEGVKNYQVRKMETDKEGNVYYRLPTENLYGKRLEYYIVESGTDVSRSLTPIYTINEFTSQESPEIYFQQDDMAAADDSGSKTPFVKLEGSGTVTAQIHDDSDSPGEKFDATGNLKIYNNITKNKFKLDFDTNFSYTHKPADDESNVNLTGMTVRLSSGSHLLEAGDLNIDNTEFTTASLGQRGIRYEMSGKTLYLSSFFTNSQQKTGFDGFGIPPSDAYLFGALAGLNIGTVAKLRGIFLTGKDNMNSKTVVSTEDPYREGSVYSIWGEFNLFQSRLNLKGEFSRCNYGKAADEATISKESDTAWRAGANFNYGVFSARADYKKVGAQFNSIATVLSQQDWEGLDSEVGLNINTFSLTGTYIDKKNNLSSLVMEIYRTREVSSEFSWLMANHIKIGAGYGLTNLDYDKSTGLPTGSEAMDTTRYSVSLGYRAGENELTLTFGKKESKNFTSDIDAQVTGRLKLGTFLSLDPTFSYVSNKEITSGDTSKVYAMTLISTFTFIPELLSLNVTGSWTKSDSESYDSTILAVDGSVMLDLAKLFNYKVTPSFSLNGRYEDSDSGGVSNSYVTLYLQANLSF